jgi:ABC-2 type transport system permease protein
MATRSVSVAQGVSQRGRRLLIKFRFKLLPPILVPLFFFAAFNGALSGIGDSKGFEYYDYTAFQFVFLLYMSAIFSGVFTAFDIASDFESGIGSRLLLAAPRRMSIIAGYLIVSLGRGLLAVAVVWAVALAVGMEVRGDALDIAALVLLALILNQAITLYGAGVALRLRSRAAETLILIPVFLLLFLTPVFLPRDQLSDLLQALSGVNPLTAAMEAGRGFLADDPVSVGLAFACAIGLLVVFFIWAMLGMRKASRG